MANCYHCRSDVATSGYCPDCLSLDPFPRRRWLIQAVVTAVATVAVGTAVMAAVARIEPAPQPPEPATLEATGREDLQGTSLQVASGG